MSDDKEYYYFVTRNKYPFKKSDITGGFSNNELLRYEHNVKQYGELNDLYNIEAPTNKIEIIGGAYYSSNTVENKLIDLFKQTSDEILETCPTEESNNSDTDEEEEEFAVLESSEFMGGFLTNNETEIESESFIDNFLTKPSVNNLEDSEFDIAHFLI